MHPAPEYRRDIDGLRGVAIAAVVLFHVWPKALPGGFTGVDVFFVISGFLITGHLRDSLGEGLSIGTFYARRVRRLFPALLTVLAAALVLGSGILLDTEWQQLGKHAVGGLAYVSNFVLWSEGGYFDGPAAFKPLHHLWSLAVEEQFYILWPWLLWLGHRTKRPALIVVAIIGASFASNVMTMGYDPNEAFFLPSGRFWELGLGGLLTFVDKLEGRVAWALGLIGGLLVVAGFAMTSELQFPGYQVLIPTLGAAALIASRGGALAPILSSRALVGVGLISYPLYLWHWPLLVFARLATSEFVPAGAALPIASSLLVVVSSVVLSVLTWRFVEQPVRVRKAVSVPALFAMAGVLLVVSATIMTGVLRSPTTNEQTAVYAAIPVEPLQPEAMPVTTSVPPFLKEAIDTRPPEIAFVGDSAMQQFSLAVLTRARKGPVRPFVFITASGCSPMLDLELGWCRDARTLLKKELEAPSLKTIVIASQWAHYFDNPMIQWQGAPIVPETGHGQRALAEFKDWVAELSKTKQVIVVMNAPIGPGLHPHQMVHRRWWSSALIDDQPFPRTELEAFIRRSNDPVRQAALAGGATVIDPFDWLCDDKLCPRAENGAPLYRDLDHVRPSTLVARFRAFDPLLDP